MSALVPIKETAVSQVEGSQSDDDEMQRRLLLNIKKKGSTDSLQGYLKGRSRDEVGSTAQPAEDEDSHFTVEEAIESVGFGRYQAFLVFYAGMVWLADAMEVILLSYVGPGARCEWGLSGTQEGLISSAVFMGILIGAYGFGVLSDAKGRRVGFFTTAVFTFVFGLLSAWSPHYWVLVVCRMLVGFGLGGAPVMFSLYMEFLPASRRGFFLVFIEFFWTIGTILEALLAWLIMPTLHWRVLVAASAMPFVLLLVLYPFLPESPRFLMLRGDAAAATEVLRQMAKVNGKSLPPGHLSLTGGPSPASAVEITPQRNVAATPVTPGTTPLSQRFRPSLSPMEKFEDVPMDDSPAPRWRSPTQRAGGWAPVSDTMPSVRHVRLQSSTPSNSESGTPRQGLRTPLSRGGSVCSEAFVTLLSPPLRHPTLLLWLVFFICAFTYYGIVLLTTEVIGGGKSCPGLGANKPLFQTSASAPAPGPQPIAGCHGKLPTLTDASYREVLITSLAEVPGLVAASVLVDWIGRKASLAGSLSLCAAFCLPLLNASLPESISTGLLAGARACIMGGFSVLWVYAPEIYPTFIRSTGLGIANCWGRIGAAVCPFVAIGMVEGCHRGLAVSVFTVVPLLGAVASLFFRRETKGEALEDNLEQHDQSVGNSMLVVSSRSEAHT